mmetsp:Transcript_30691/g.33074  ORF Transcript_30691/g.33074 Transcript_30691/m.33074 type:complete len:229 (+) Transcript_30691:49-735(+)
MNGSYRTYNRIFTCGSCLDTIAEEQHVGATTTHQHRQEDDEDDEDALFTTSCSPAVFTTDFWHSNRELKKSGTKVSLLDMLHPIKDDTTHEEEERIKLDERIDAGDDDDNHRTKQMDYHIINTTGLWHNSRCNNNNNSMTCFMSNDSPLFIEDDRDEDEADYYDDDYDYEQTTNVIRQLEFDDNDNDEEGEAEVDSDLFDPTSVTVPFECSNRNRVEEASLTFFHRWS